jgi:hypothetical protein
MPAASMVRGFKLALLRMAFVMSSITFSPASMPAPEEGGVGAGAGPGSEGGLEGEMGGGLEGDMGAG